MSDASLLQIFNQTSSELPFEPQTAYTLLESVSEGENARFAFVELVYVDEDTIVSINKEYLDRDYITDIISFRYDEDEDSDAIEGTLYCCAPRIAEQAKEYSSSLSHEFMRILAHGLLHLIGYDDQTPSEKSRMTELEDHYLKKAGISGN